MIAFSASAADFRSVQESAAVLYDAPSRQATPLFVVSRSYPLEEIGRASCRERVSVLV